MCVCTSLKPETLNHVSRAVYRCFLYQFCRRDDTAQCVPARKSRIDYFTKAVTSVGRKLELMIYHAVHVAAASRP